MLTATFTTLHLNKKKNLCVNDGAVIESQEFFLQFSL